MDSCNFLFITFCVIFVPESYQGGMNEQEGCRLKWPINSWLCPCRNCEKPRTGAKTDVVRKLENISKDSPSMFQRFFLSRTFISLFLACVLRGVHVGFWNRNGTSTSTEICKELIEVIEFSGRSKDSETKSWSSEKFFQLSSVVLINSTHRSLS